jgi:hypothetical protein
MPINKYFSGHGDEVMSSMKKTYGSKKAKNVFYATANKRKQKGLDTGPSHSAKKRLGV